MKKRHSLALGLLSLVQGACVTPPPLERPPWHGNAAGSEAWTGKLGLATLYSAGSDLRIESQPGSDSPIDPIVEELETDMIGRFGMGFGYQRFLAEDLALSLGVEGRFTATEVVDPPLLVADGLYSRVRRGIAHNNPAYMSVCVIGKGENNI